MTKKTNLEEYIEWLEEETKGWSFVGFEIIDGIPFDYTHR